MCYAKGMPNSNITLDSAKRLSESAIFWSLQRPYFDTQGVHAWTGSVPFFVTSNQFIARRYAQLINAYLADRQSHATGAKQETVYILELGTGSGQFSFYVLKHLSRLMQVYGSAAPKFCYVMTDFTENNIQYWQTHPALQPYIRDLKLDFAHYDMENDQSIDLINQSITLKKDGTRTPLIVLANYIFDTVTCDAFYINNYKTQELQLSLHTTADNMQNDKIIDTKKIKTTFQTKDIDINTYYQDEKINNILAFYQKNIEQSNVLIPVASLRSIAHLFDISQNDCMIISSDKGKTTLSEIDHTQEPHIAFHGSVSFSVNFDAITRYIAQHQGEAYIPEPRRGIRTVLYLNAPQKMEQCPRLMQEIDQSIEGFSPADFFLCYRQFIENDHTPTLNTLNAQLAFCLFDTHVFKKLLPRILKAIVEANALAKNKLRSNLEKIANSFYIMPHCHDVFHSIAECHFAMGDYQLAKAYFTQSQQTFEDSDITLYNLSLCNIQLNKLSAAIEQLNLAHRLNPNNTDVINLLKKINQQQS